ncbi:MAG: hypothetical protein ACTH4Y_08155 [Microbacterium gubbeenense]|uniref:hypothetical protein n=1 Tax=Microbacterium gubbeenense TaxID=159896 RepID=UPI003F96FB42
MRKRVVGLMVAGMLAVGGFGVAAAPAPVTSEAAGYSYVASVPKVQLKKPMRIVGHVSVPKVQFKKSPLKFGGYVSVPKVQFKR